MASSRAVFILGLAIIVTCLMNSCLVEGGGGGGGRVGSVLSVISSTVKGLKKYRGVVRKADDVLDIFEPTPIDDTATSDVTPNVAPTLDAAAGVVNNYYILSASSAASNKATLLFPAMVGLVWIINYI